MPAATTLEKPAPAALSEPDLDDFEPMTLAGFADFCVRYPDLRTELSAHGEPQIMPPAFAETGRFNADVTADLVLWNRRQRLGRVFDSSAGFTLPNGAIYSPDVSWVSLERWDALTETQQAKFAQICPDFVVEIRSSTDRPSKLRAKMTEYLSNGARLGWLLDPKNKRVEIFRLGRDLEKLDAPESLSGEDVLPGFILLLKEIWS